MVKFNPPFLSLRFPARHRPLTDELSFLLTWVDVNHDLLKTRINRKGEPIMAASKGKELAGDAERVARQKLEGYCGTCYGGTPPTDGPNPGCCNSCDDVRESYVRRGWSFVNPDSIEQVEYSRLSLIYHVV
jgi:hypothetical protein